MGKIEADANKFSFVWKKAVVKSEDKLDKKAGELYQELVSKAILPQLISEMKSELSLDELTQIKNILLDEHQKVSEEISQTQEITSRKVLRIRRSEINKARKAFQDFAERKSKYQVHKEICGERNSYSKTDTDATFMHMKEDYMNTGQLRPAYNVQIATNHQYVLDYALYPNPTDTRTLIPFDQVLDEEGIKRESQIEDAGYGSEENYLHLLDKGITPLITYNSFEKEQKRKFKKNPYQRENWPYDEGTDTYLCPNGKKFIFVKEFQKKNRSGFESTLRVYECEKCSGCPFKSDCTKAKGNRQIQINRRWEKFKAHIKALLKDKVHGKIYKRRKIEVEPVFGDIKHNAGFRRFHLRGKEKVSIEMGLVFLAHNFRKIRARIRAYGTKEIIQTQIGG